MTRRVQFYAAAGARAFPARHSDPHPLTAEEKMRARRPRSQGWNDMTNRIELRIAERTPFADGMAFGDAGPYERLWGRAHTAVDPDAPAQAGIVDIGKAPRNADGLVTFASDLLILKPLDPARGNRRVFFDWGNRGNNRAVQFFCDAPASNEIRTAAHARSEEHTSELQSLMRISYAVFCFNKKKHTT